MHPRSGWYVVVTWLLLTLAATPGADQGADTTREANKGGASVVEAVVDLIRSNCIFSEDRLFLRRLAYVESRDGTDIKTYRPGYDGGIWQVDEDKFNATLACSSVLATYCAKIRQPPFNINWRSVTWSDLRKPLYSGLAATFYLLLRLGDSTSAIPGDIKNQSILWSQYYRPGLHPSNFESVADNSTAFDCKRETDMVFVLDSSGSISDSNFDLSLDFAARVVEAMSIPEPLRVAALIYANSPVIEFNFSKEQTSPGVAAAIRGIRRVTGGTATDKALDMARSSLLSNSSSAREGANRVVVLVTDGQSDNTNRTIQAAERLRDEGQAAVFAIGVGGYSLPELKAVATQPKCLHVFTLDDFAVISSIIYEIQRSTCTAHQTIGVDKTNIELNSTQDTGAFVIPRQEPNKTVMFEVQCGTLDVYVSFTNPKPSPALYTHKYTARDGRPAYLLTSSANDGLPVYISVVGTQLPPSLAAIEQCTGFRIHIATVDRPWPVRCCNDQVCRDCTKSDLLQQITLLTDVCDTRDLSFQNPCTREALLAGKTIFPYIYDSNKFIRCDYRGNAYVTLCPRGQTFNSGSLSCGSEVSGVPYGRPLPASYPNPCTPEKLLAQYFFFEYPPDRQLFIHCDPWGGAWLQTCPTLEVWNQELLTCVVDHPLAPTTNLPATMINPCTPEMLAAGKFFHPYLCDHTRYIHCDITGQYWVQYCPVGMFYHPEVFVCVVGDPQGSSGAKTEIFL
ncbi:uncharacterized protein LOC112568475 [Pomacea canaliculata]|uniref:uncharacterized protein LOC112568475 n=1 Tax=Pomacea canaliculata TaxID=400727 RepID=UPI000D73F686|nr:uncharacterized protein LOC112568475 [Pomacea canaliculata]